MKDVEFPQKKTKENHAEHPMDTDSDRRCARISIAGSVTIWLGAGTGQTTLLPFVSSVFISVHPWLKGMVPPEAEGGTPYRLDLERRGADNQSN